MAESVWSMVRERRMWYCMCCDDLVVGGVRRICRHVCDNSSGAVHNRQLYKHSDFPGARLSCTLLTHGGNAHGSGRRAAWKRNAREYREDDNASRSDYLPVPEMRQHKANAGTSLLGVSAMYSKDGPSLSMVGFLHLI